MRNKAGLGKTRIKTGKQKYRDRKEVRDRGVLNENQDFKAIGGQKIRPVCFLFFLLSVLSGAQVLPAQPAGPSGKGGSFSFCLENDVWLKRDDGYTNGVQLMWVSPGLGEKSSSSFLRFLNRLNVRLLGQDDRKNQQLRFSGTNYRRAALSLVQGMFTPADLTKEEVVPADRPYAGLLCAGLTLIRGTSLRQDSLGLAIGLVGSHSYAESLQRWLHRTYGWVYPEGWKNQLRDEPVLEIWFNRQWTLVVPRPSASGLSSAVKAGVGGQLGNLMTAAEAILDLRLGFNLQPEADSFSPAPLFGQIELTPAEKTSLYLLLRVEGKAIDRNLLLEGNTFTDSHSVELNHFYGQLISGLVYRSAEAALSFYWVLRTKEFKGQRYFDPYCGLTFSFNL